MDRAEHHLVKAEKNGQSMLKALHKAERGHNKAVSEIQEAQNDLQVCRVVCLFQGDFVMGTECVDEKEKFGQGDAGRKGQEGAGG